LTGSQQREISIMQTLSLYTRFLNQGLNVTAFDSDENTITFDRVTSSEIIALSKGLNALDYKNEVILMDTLKFKIRFI
jgi:hypothetical protein